MPPPDCPFCDHQNPAGAKFCNECGSPLHLTPCGDCGAVNNLTDTHCWRCGSLLLVLDPSVPVEHFERERAVPEQLVIELLPTELPPTTQPPTEQELEREIVALEQEVQALERAPGSADRGARGLAQEPRDIGVATAAPLLAEAGGGPRHRPRGVTATASVAVLASAIAVGAYLYDRDRAPPASGAPTSPVSSPLQAAAPTQPRVVRDVGEAPAGPAPAAGPEAGCPPAVEAMVLCEWLVRAHRQ